MFGRQILAEETQNDIIFPQPYKSRVGLYEENKYLNEKVRQQFAKLKNRKPPKKKVVTITREQESDIDRKSNQELRTIQSEVAAKIISGAPLGDDDRNYLNTIRNKFQKKIDFHQLTTNVNQEILNEEAAQIYFEYINKISKENEIVWERNKKIAIAISAVAVAGSFFCIFGTDRKSVV